MKHYLLMFLVVIITGCKGPSETSFLSDDISISGKFYFISANHQIDKSRPLIVLCPMSDSITVVTDFKTVGFDSADYLFLDRPLKIPNQIDSAIAFNETHQMCHYPICIQLTSNFKVVSRKQLNLQEIKDDSRLSHLTPTCDAMDRAIVFELKSEKDETYYVYDIALYKMCEKLKDQVLLYKGNELINSD